MHSAWTSSSAWSDRSPRAGEKSEKCCGPGVCLLATVDPWERAPVRPFTHINMQHKQKAFGFEGLQNISRHWVKGFCLQLVPAGYSRAKTKLHLTLVFHLIRKIHSPKGIRFSHYKRMQENWHLKLHNNLLFVLYRFKFKVLNIEDRWHLQYINTVT